MAIIIPSEASALVDHFTQFPNAWFRDSNLSYKAKGLLAAIHTHRRGYRLTVEQLVSQSRDGREGVLTGLQELEAAGFLRRVTTRGPDGKITGKDWLLLDRTLDGIPAPDSPVSEKPTAAEPPAVSPRHRTPVLEDQGSRTPDVRSRQRDPKIEEEEPLTAGVDPEAYDLGSGQVDDLPLPALETVEAPPPTPPRRAARGTAAPDAIEITEAMRAWAAESAPLVTDLAAETDAMLDYHVARGSTFRRWDAAWRTWVRNAQKYAERDSHRPGRFNGHNGADEDLGPGRLRDAHGTVWSGAVPMVPGAWGPNDDYGQHAARATDESEDSAESVPW